MAGDAQRQDDGQGRVIARIYEAALRPGDWSAALHAVCDSVQGSSAFLFSTLSRTDPNAVLLLHNHPPEAAVEYARHWHAEDPWAHAAARRGLLRRNDIVTSSEILPRRDLLRTAYHNDFNRPLQVESLLGCVLFDDHEGDGMPLTNLALHRGPGQPDFDLDSKRRLAGLVPHLQHAMRLQRTICALDAPHTPATSALAALDIASLVLDAAGRVVECNDVGRRLLATDGAFRFSAGRLRSIGLKCVPPLADAMQRCSRGTPVRLLARLGSRGAAVVNATLLKLPAATPTRIGAFDAERWLLLVEVQRDDLASIAQRVAELFGLSPAEVRVLALLLEGCAAAAIATRTGTALPTVRTHIRSIFAKTEVSRQIDLVRLLAGLRA